MLQRHPIPWLFDFLAAFAAGGGDLRCLLMGEPPQYVLDAVMGCCP